jgi:cytochrome c-type biogenesis protein CcmH/NrfG
MSPLPEPLTEFERNARAVLEQSVLRIDGRTRSRLNQARQAAVAAAAAKRGSWWRGFTLMPAGAVTAALLVAVVLWQRHPAPELPVLEASHATAESPAEDIDLLADGDAMELMEGWDGSFYEWAAAQNDASGQSKG